jgi:hypothetical protein
VPGVLVLLRKLRAGGTAAERLDGRDQPWLDHALTPVKVDRVNSTRLAAIRFALGFAAPCSGRQTTKC